MLVAVQEDEQVEGIPQDRMAWLMQQAIQSMDSDDWVIWRAGISAYVDDLIDSMAQNFRRSCSFQTVFSNQDYQICGADDCTHTTALHLPVIKMNQQIWTKGQLVSGTKLNLASSEQKSKMHISPVVLQRVLCKLPSGALSMLFSLSESESTKYSSLVKRPLFYLSATASACAALLSYSPLTSKAIQFEMSCQSSGCWVCRNKIKQGVQCWAGYSGLAGQKEVDLPFLLAQGANITLNRTFHTWVV